MRNSGFWWVIVGIMIILDIYVYQAIKVVLPEHSPKARLIIIVLYRLVSITVIGVLVMMPFINFDNWPRGIRTLSLCHHCWIILCQAHRFHLPGPRRYPPRRHVGDRQTLFQSSPWRSRRHRMASHVPPSSAGSASLQAAPSSAPCYTVFPINTNIISTGSRSASPTCPPHSKD